MSTMPMNWIHQIYETLQEMQEIPLWGNPPPIPWDQCIQEVAAILQTPELSLVVGYSAASRGKSTIRTR